MQVIEMFVCEGCEHTTQDEPEGPLYECGNCGTTFNRAGSSDGESNRCPDCKKFAARIGDYGCDECGSAEMTKEPGFECPDCGEAVLRDSLREHLLEEHSEMLAEGYVDEYLTEQGF